MSDIGLINTIQAPELAETTQPSLIEFETKYTAYKDRVGLLNSTRSEGQRLPHASIRQCIKPEILHSMCILGYIEGASSAEEATDESVQLWFENQMRETGKDLIDRVDQAIAGVKFRFVEGDPKGSAQFFIISIVAQLDKMNASSVVKEPEQCKELILKLMKKVNPPAVRQLLFKAKTLWIKTERSDLKFFADQLSEYSAQVQRVSTAMAESSNRGPSQKGDKYAEKDKNAKNKNAGRENQKEKDDSSVGTGGKQGSENWKNKQKGREEYQPDCLNPDCTEKHMLKDCKITSKEQAKKLLADYRARKKQKTAKCRDNLTQSRDGRYKIFLEGLETIAIGDTGADFNCIPISMFRKLNHSEENIRVKDINPPIEIENAISLDDEEKFATASRQVELTLTIIIPGCELPVRLKNVSFVVVDQGMTESIIGRPLLKTLGFDLNEHLKSVRDRIDGMSVEDIKVAKQASISYQGTRYRDCNDDPVEQPSILKHNFGVDSKQSIDKAFQNILHHAKKNGISPKGLSELEAMLETFRDNFRINLGPDPPAKVRPLKIELKEGATPVKSPQRRYAPSQRVFINSTIKNLEKVGAVYKNPTAKWASPALAVPKPGTDALRFTVDLRKVNAKTEPIQAAMPHMDSMVQECEGSTVMANVDFCHGYWQLGLHENSQELMSIQTPLGVYSPRRTLQGGMDSGNHFQLVTSEAFEGKIKRLLQWIDDFLLHAPSDKELLMDIRIFLEVCKEFGFKIHAEKSSFFLKEAKFCGKIISADGVRFDPRNMAGIVDMKKPEKANELQ